MKNNIYLYGGSNVRVIQKNLTLLYNNTEEIIIKVMIRFTWPSAAIIMGNLG